jgi:NADPH-dependent curcumin reductase CurA
MKSRQIHLVARPTGVPTLENFAFVDVELPALKEGEVLVRNLWMSVDPYMRGRMDERCSYNAPFELGAPLLGDALGRIEESRHPGFPVGAIVAHKGAWRDLAIIDVVNSYDPFQEKGAEIIKADPEIPLHYFLSVLGMTGMAAYTGLLLVCGLQKGETVFVSGAAGAVGSVACQIAKLHGCRVVGSAGSKEKLSWLKYTIGVDEAINYKLPEQQLFHSLAAACPLGIDVYFENVGGLQMEAALEAMNNHGRIALCGLIQYYQEDYYNDRTINTGPRNFIQIPNKWIMASGFDVWNPRYWSHYGEFVRLMSGWIKGGKVVVGDTIVEGLEKAPDALIGLFTGANKGKMLVRLGG